MIKEITIKQSENGGIEIKIDSQNVDNSFVKKRKVIALLYAALSIIFSEHA